MEPDRGPPVRCVVFPPPPLFPALLLLLAVVLGGGMVARLLSGRSYPRRLGWTHGALALLGVGLLAFVALAGPVDPWLDDGALFLVMAASGGGMLAVLGGDGKRPVGVLVFLHALFAVVGVVLLAIALGRPGVGS